jgi:hypothetical protein
MRRRALLRAAALAGVAGIAGCTSDGQNDGGGGDGDPEGKSPTDSPTDTPTDTPTDAPESPTRTPLGNGIIAESFDLTGRGCGEGKNTVDITFDGDEIRLDGVIDGSNGCYVAEQESVDFDPHEDHMRVNVRAFEPDDAGVCTQCIVDIEYEARYVFEGGTPEEVVVAHDDRDIATAAQGSASAGPS